MFYQYPVSDRPYQIQFVTSCPERRSTPRDEKESIINPDWKSIIDKGHTFYNWFL